MGGVGDRQRRVVSSKRRQERKHGCRQRSHHRLKLLNVELLQICWAATEETPAGSYVSAAVVKQPSAFARSDEGLLLEHDLWQEMVAQWVKVAPEIKNIVA